METTPRVRAARGYRLQMHARPLLRGGRRVRASPWRSLQPHAFGFRSVATPTLRAQSGKSRSISIHAEIAGDAICLMDGHIQLIAIGVGNQKVLPLELIQRSRDQPLKSADAVIHVDHMIAKPSNPRRQIRAAGVLGARCGAWASVSTNRKFPHRSAG